LDKPILFSTPMIPPLLNLKPNTWPPEPIDPSKPFKWQTRRPVKPQPTFESGYDTPYENELGIYWKTEESYSDIESLMADMIEKSPYQPGDVLWVREMWANTWTPGDDTGFVYKADGQPPAFPYWGNESLCKFEVWRPSIHMPREAARLFLTVKDVRVQRVGEISEEDARAEGIKKAFDYYCGAGHPVKGIQKVFSTARNAFASIWDSIYAKQGYGWEPNNWVWVYELERVSA
jgi:hypothetical protein